MKQVDRHNLFERAARAYHAGIYNYLCWLCRNRELAADLVQETFLRLWQNPPEARGEPALKAWLYKVARNEYLQNRRKTSPVTMTLDDAEVGEHVANDFTSLEFERMEDARQLRAIVESLPPIYREVIVLHNLEELSMSQVADVLEIPVGTVKSRRAKAFVLLRQVFAAEVKCYEM